MFDSIQNLVGGASQHMIHAVFGRRVIPDVRDRWKASGKLPRSAYACYQMYRLCGGKGSVDYGAHDHDRSHYEFYRDAKAKWGLSLDEIGPLCGITAAELGYYANPRLAPSEDLCLLHLFGWLLQMDTPPDPDALWQQAKPAKFVSKYPDKWADELRAFAAYSGLSRADLADAVGISQSHLSNLLIGRQGFRPSQSIARLVSLLHIVLSAGFDPLAYEGRPHAPEHLRWVNTMLCSSDNGKYPLSRVFGVTQSTIYRWDALETEFPQTAQRIAYWIVELWSAGKSADVIKWANS